MPLSLHGQNTLIEKFILLNFFTMKYIVGLHMQSHSVKYLLPDRVSKTHTFNEAVKQLRIRANCKILLDFLNIRKGSRSIVLYFKLLPLAVFRSDSVLFISAAKAQQSTVTAAYAVPYSCTSTAL